jgi:hypothetical protein
MKVKRSLENRLRGWFPQEPYFFSRNCRVETSTKNPPLMIRPEYTNSATKFAGETAILSTIFSGLLLSSLNFVWQPFPVYHLVAWMIAGAIIGMVSCTVYTKRELCRLSRNYQIEFNWRENSLFALLPFFVFAVASLLATSHVGLSLGVALFSWYALAVSYGSVRYGLLRYYEKTENMRIITSWSGLGYAVIPKPPNQRMSLKQGSELRLP